MSNSNGMYSVLDVFKKLEPVEQPTAKQQAQAIYESVEARGSILEGVGRVEKKLAEQFASFKEGSTDIARQKLVKALTRYDNSDDMYDNIDQLAKQAGFTSIVNGYRLSDDDAEELVVAALRAKGLIEGEKVPVKGGIVHKGTYGNSYNDDEPAASDGPRKRGRPPKGTPKKVKPAGEKRGRGRPTKDTSTELKTKGGDIFGRTTGEVPKGKKGTVIKGKGNIDESRLMEGVNFAEMMRETEMTVGEMLETIQNDIKVFKETGMCSDTLEAFLKIHNHGKKQLQDATVPRGPSFAPQHADIPPVQKPGILDRAKGMVKTGLEKLGHPDDAGMRADLRQKMGVEEELNELAKLAGIETEGNAFTGKLAQTKKGDSFELDGKKFKDTSSLDNDVEEGNAFTGKLAQTKKGDSFELDGKKFKDTSNLDESLEECMSPMGSAAQSMEQQEGRINVSTNMSSDGNKSVNISADGNAADQLMQMLKMAGMGGEQAEKHVQLMIAKPQGSEEMEEATGQYANTPEEEYAGVDTIIDQGEDMNRQKKQFADKPRQGDNPMATQPMAEEIDPIGTLGRDLMKEYQALKLAK